MSGTDIELLETYLDGALPAGEAQALADRLTTDPALSAQLDQLRVERALRLSAFASMEPDDATADRLLAGVRGQGKRLQTRIFWTAPLRYVAAAAACIAMGFLMGRLMETRTQRGAATSPQIVAQSYQVAITDDVGQVIAVQKFDSLEQATEFSDDLRRWQERQERVRNGQVTIRSARF